MADYKSGSIAIIIWRSEVLIIDNLYKYEVDKILEGGMGRVLLLTRISSPELFEDSIYDRSNIQDTFNFPYRKKLAAKTVKDGGLMRDFERECLIWLDIKEIGIAPLLKVVRIDGLTFALMPRYLKSLRNILESKNINRLEIIRLFYEPVLGMANIYSSKGLVHLDIKPENLLYSEDGKNVKLHISDWGIANLQANLLSKTSLESTRFTFQTMAGFGTIPYMAPERFFRYYSTIGADIFSFGIVFIEIITGNWPYNLSEPIENQIISGKYFLTATKMLSGYSNQKISNAILLMIHPSVEKRMQSYKDILKFIKSV